MARTTEFVLGLIGGILGFMGAFIAMLVGGLGGVLGAQGATTVVALGWSAIVFSIVGIVGSALVKTKTNIAAWLMIAAAVGGIISISFAYLLAFVLLLVAGLMALLKKEKKK